MQSKMAVVVLGKTTARVGRVNIGCMFWRGRLESQIVGMLYKISNDG